MNKLIEDNHYLVWTDALHAKKLAEQARNQWDRGSYVRWAILSAWIVMETACQEVLKDKRISYSFKKNLNESLTRKGLPNINWRSDPWQGVLNVLEKRKDYSHRSINHKKMFPDAFEARDAINAIREGFKEIHKIAGAEYPSWIDDDSDKGFDTTPQGSCHVCSIEDDANENDPDTIIVKYKSEGKEYVTRIFKKEFKIEREFEHLKHNATCSMTEINAYRNNSVIKSVKVAIRGSKA